MKVTEEQMKARIRYVDYVLHKGTTLTTCTIQLDNSFTVVGESACVDQSLFNKQIGEELAYEDAFRKLWPLFGFLLAEDRWRSIQKEA